MFEKVIINKTEPYLSRVWSYFSSVSFRLGLLCLGAGTVILLQREETDYLFQELIGGGRLYALPFGVGLLAYGAASLMVWYLTGALTLTRSGATLDELPESVSLSAVTVLRSRISDLSDEVKALKSAQLDALSGNRDELIEALKPTVHGGLADELTRRFSEQAQQATRDAEIRQAFASAQQRLQFELSSLSRRSNLNLVIGVITTSIAVGLLTYMVLGATANFESLNSILAHYVPRLALVIFIEVFSFFFLRLYRATLAEMRTYQTDLTSLTIQFVAVQAALSAKTPESAVALSKELLLSKPQPSPAQKESKLSEADAKAVSELLQGAAKALLPNAKGG